MKQKLLHQSLIATLVTMLLLLAGSSASAYNLEIAGGRVTSENCSDLTVLPGVTGKVSYDPTTKTLTLEDASIDGGEDCYSIWSDEELTCVVKGKVSITSNGWGAIKFHQNAIIKGNGQLTIKASTCGIRADYDLLIEGCTVYAEGKKGILGVKSDYSASGPSLRIRYASVTAKGTEGSICGFTLFTLEGSDILKPAGAVWNYSKGVVCDASDYVIKDEVVIASSRLEIAGVKVTSANCSDLTAIPGVKGKVSYDPTTKTLTLEDASIDGGEHHGIDASDELTCVVKGKVSITSNDRSAMMLYGNAIIKGNGQLTLKSRESCGIYIMNALLIEGCTVYTEGNLGIASETSSSGASLTIRNASVTAKGTEGSICLLTNFTLEGCEITKPAGAVWNAEEHAVCDASGNDITDEVVIAPVEEYGLEIAGVKVTSANCSDLTAIPGVKGKVSYDPATKTLTLEDASIDVGEQYLGISSTDELTCVVKGKVSITSNKWRAMVFYKNAIIKGNGQLTLKSSERCVIYTEAALLIEGCTVYAEGVFGIAGKDGSSGESLTIRNAFVTAKGRGRGSICDLANFTLEGCEITKPAGAVWNADEHAVCDASGNVITDEVVIAPVKTYGLEIAGVKVTSANCSDLTAIPGVKGKVSYDPATKTLTLEDASIDGGEQRDGIWSNDQLTCVVKGKVSITSTNMNAMAFAKNAIIKGNGQLTLKSSEVCGIYTEAALLIEGCTVYAEGVFGIAGRNGTSGESLTIRNASVTAKGTEGSICDLANFTLEGCEITKPAGAVWNASKHAVCDASGNVIKDEVVITPVEEYGLEIADVQVTSANCSDLSVINGVTGKVTYDPATKTLTLEDASIDVGQNIGISSYDELTCVVKGEVSINSGNDRYAMVFYNNVIIKGNGQLTIKSPVGCGIYTEAALLIEGCTVYAEGVFGIAGKDGSSGESLTIRNAFVTAKGRGRGSICDLANFTLEGCEITKPAGAVWNADEHAVCDASGNVITDKVVISPKGGTAIDFVTPELQPADGAIYDINGVLRSEPLDELPTGVYIVGGQKVMHVQR